MNGYLLMLVIVLIAFVVIALARILAPRKLPHPHHWPAGSDGQDAVDRGDPERNDRNSR